MAIQRLPKLAAVLAPCLGVLLHTYISFFEASKGPNAFTLGLLVWASVPYLICLIIAFSGSERSFLGFCGATAALLGDLWTYYSVFIASTSSTSAISLLFAPMVSLVVWVPLGVFLGYVASRFEARRVTQETS